MKKKLVIGLCLVLALSLALCGCGSSKDAEESEAKAEETAETEETEEAEEPTPVGGNIVNPMTERESLEEVNSLTGGNLQHPGVMGVTDEKFFTYDLSDYILGEYEFSINGNKFTFRNALTADHDISGVYINGELAFGEAKDGIEYVFDGDTKLARWFTLDGQYTLCTESETYSEETFKMIAEEMEALVDIAMTDSETQAYYESLAGEYQDNYSQRAVLDAEAGDDCLNVLVHWSSSATEFTQWTMTLHLSEDGLLYYTDCKKEECTVDEKEGDKYTTVYENGEGFFGENEGILYWNGASEEDCKECTFQKAE